MSRQTSSIRWTPEADVNGTRLKPSELEEATADNIVGIGMELEVKEGLGGRGYL